MASEHPPTPQAKPYQCQGCSRSFGTQVGANTHSRATGHLIPCTVTGCARGFVSADALAAHLATANHAAQKFKKKEMLRSKATRMTPTSGGSSQGEPSGGRFLCTAPGCEKVFKTSQARWQHVHSPFHTKKTVQAVGKKVVETVTPLQNSGAVDSLTVAQLAAAGEEQVEKGKKPKGPERVTAPAGKSGVHQGGAASAQTPTAQAGKQAVHHKRAVPSSKTTQPSASHTTKLPKHEPLFRWDTRWSKIPDAALVSTLISLKAQIPPPESSAAVDKKFWTPDSKRAPAQAPGLQKRLAIALDCEMIGTGPNGSVSELARLSALDFFTGELLIDSLVRPLRAVTDWRTRFSGITAAAMEAAVQSGDVLDGSTAARARLFEFMDAQTVLVGHAVRYDLGALGIVHTQIVDSALLAKAAVGKNVKREWGLKTLCKELLGVVIQDNLKDGHDAVEDALAAREVVVWCLGHEKELNEWGKKQKGGYPGKGKGKKAQGSRWRVRTPQVWYDDESDGEEFRNLSLEEFNELCGYPPWYDNWSD